MKKKILALFTIIGLLVFLFLIYKTGIDKIWNNITRLAWYNFLFLIFLRFFYWLIRTICWKTVLKGYNNYSSLPHLFAVRLSCHTINLFTPSANLGGNAARALMINHPNKKASIASVIIDKTIEYLTIIFLTIIGIMIFITKVKISGYHKLVAFCLVTFATLLILFLLFQQKKGLLSTIIRLLNKIGLKPKIIEKNLEKIIETDQYISSFYKNHLGLFVKTILLYLFLVLIWTTEIHITLFMLGAENFLFIDSFLIITLGVIAFVLPITPASIGIYEATYIGLFAVLGYNTDLCISLVLTRRIIALFWAGIGLLGMHLVKRERKNI